ncbi:hypothetical protein E2C01_005744 [Portunus trituberculatus]|uniref:Uncharacterized protein n=1 Tax=Portunus trituberculatus TaxID=210409 RepID=A0A5B7CXE4_PORTR|nr:hypothetical protein [Portunus trituberculatus]
MQGLFIERNLKKLFRTPNNYHFSTKTYFHIYSAYYLVILYSFTNVCMVKKSEDCGH